MTTLTLRGLAKAYSDNIVDRKKYIRERRELIDNITSGQVPLVPYEPSPPPQVPDLERTFSDGETTLELPQIETDGSEPPPRKSNVPIVLAAIVALAVIVLIGWIKLAPQNDHAPASIKPTIAAPAIDQANTGAELLSEFLGENQWQPERIDEFHHDWQSLSPDAKLENVDSPAMHRVIDSIYQKFLEENALLELGDREDVLAAQRQLLDLATELSPHNERVERLEEDWRANNAQALALRDVEPQTIEPSTVTITAPSKTPDNLTTTFESPAADPAQVDTEMLESKNDNLAVRVDPEPPAVEAEITPATPATEDFAPLAPENTPVQNDEQSTPAAPVQTSPTRDAKKPAAKKKSSCRAALAKQRRPFCRDPIGEKAAGPALVVLPPGQVNIGGRNVEEQPTRTMSIARPFALGIFEISFNEFDLFCRATKTSCPAQPWSDRNLPVVNVPWTLAVKYTQWLSKVTGARYRLPSEGEWEYAARAGTTTPYPFGDEVLPTHARFSFRGAETMPLSNKDRSVNRNAFRLYHMIGNVREWVLDVWHDNHAGAPLDASARSGNSDQHVVRGGSYADGAENIRSASRLRLSAQTSDTKTGFRILREVD